jgi:hypothetical protein
LINCAPETAKEFSFIINLHKITKLAVCKAAYEICRAVANGWNGLPLVPTAHKLFYSVQHIPAHYILEKQPEIDARVSNITWSSPMSARIQSNQGNCS